jgi:hypothetical protein
VLPHASHAWEVVFELGQLDLELPLGADRMLGEDVEDELRAVDDAQLELVLQAPLLPGSRSSSTTRDSAWAWSTAPINSASFPFPT